MFYQPGKPLTIAVDFDGTCVTHEYPKIGKEIGSAPVLLSLVEKGHKLILYTMRSGPELAQAIIWFGDRGIPLYGINHNPSQKTWTDSPKIFSHIYIDDAALGVPLSHTDLCDRPYVDWVTIKDLLTQRNVL